MRPLLTFNISRVHRRQEVLGERAGRDSPESGPDHKYRSTCPERTRAFRAGFDGASGRLDSDTVKIYTRKGDDGTTGLFYGGHVAKNSQAPAAYGSVDEAQAAIGVARAASRDAKLDDLLIRICRDLYVTMAELATLPENQHKLTDGETRATAEMVAQLEEAIDLTAETTPMPEVFVIPGQNLVAAQLDVARTVTRRAERDALDVAVEGSYVIPYLNRLSDLLWILARSAEGVSLPSDPTD